MSETISHLTVSLDGIRHSMFRGCTNVIESIEPLLDEYKQGEYSPSLTRDQCEDLFNSINDLRGVIGAFMCCSCEEIGLSNLDNHPNLPWIEYEKEEEDHE